MFDSDMITTPAGAPEELKEMEIAEEKTAVVETADATETEPAWETVTEDAAEPKAPKQEPVMYVGPTLTGFAIQNRVYTEIPETAKAKFGGNPELANLFVEIRQYPKANRMLREKTGYIYSAYMKALELRK